MFTGQSASPLKHTSLKISDTGLLLIVACAVFLVNAVTNGQYGFHRDELDLLMNARRLAWGYVAYPPLTPFIARLGLEIFGPSLLGLRAFAALAQGAAALLTGLMARAMGARRLAQVTAALAMAISPVALTCGTLIQYMSFDYLWWVMTAFFTVRVLKNDDPRGWLGVGASLGLGMMTKYTIFFFITGLVAGVLLTTTRRHLRSPWLWAGVGISLLIFLPNLAWQIQHQFISLDFLKSIHARDIQWGRTSGFLLEQLYVPVHPLTLPLWIAGLAFCFRPPGKRFRLLGWAFLTVFGLMLVTRSRSYYMAPAYPMLLAAGAAWLEDWLTGWKRDVATALAIGTVCIILLIKPVTPIHSFIWNIAIKFSDNFVEMVGWPDLAAQVAQVYTSIPDAEKPETVILAGNYGEAGAFDLYGRAYYLPRLISGGNSLWERGYGSPDPETVILVGFESGYADQLFESCQFAGKVSNAAGVQNEETTRHNTLFVCRGPRLPWSQMWPEMRSFQ